jgi:hypothetical protein
MEAIANSKATLEAQLNSQRCGVGVGAGEGGRRGAPLARGRHGRQAPSASLYRRPPTLLPPPPRALLDTLRNDLGSAREHQALAESLASSRGTQLEELKAQLTTLQASLADAERRVFESELMRRKLHNTIQVRALCSPAPRARPRGRVQCAPPCAHTCTPTARQLPSSPSPPPHLPTPPPPPRSSRATSACSAACGRRCRARSRRRAAAPSRSRRRSPPAVRRRAAAALGWASRSTGPPCLTAITAALPDPPPALLPTTPLPSPPRPPSPPPLPQATCWAAAWRSWCRAPSPASPRSGTASPSTRWRAGAVPGRAAVACLSLAQPPFTCRRRAPACASQTTHPPTCALNCPPPQVFAPTAGQESVFEEISELVQSALDGHKVRARRRGWCTLPPAAAALPRAPVAQRPPSTGLAPTLSLPNTYHPPTPTHPTPSYRKP